MLVSYQYMKHWDTKISKILTLCLRSHSQKGNFIPDQEATARVSASSRENSTENIWGACPVLDALGGLCMFSDLLPRPSFAASLVCWRIWCWVWSSQWANKPLPLMLPQYLSKVSEIRMKHFPNWILFSSRQRIASFTSFRFFYLSFFIASLSILCQLSFKRS